MSHCDVIVESTPGDHVFPTVRAGILEQARIVNALYMVPGCHPALESFQTNGAGKLWLPRQTRVILGDKLKQLFWIFEILNTAWNLRRILDILTTLMNHNITQSLPSKEPSRKSYTTQLKVYQYIVIKFIHFYYVLSTCGHTGYF